MGDPPNDSSRVKLSDWYRISGPLPLYIHKDDARLAGWRQQATRAFSRVVADIVWRAHRRGPRGTPERLAAPQTKPANLAGDLWW